MEHHLQDLTQLAIIGNGFDLAHGYHTRYVDFTESVGDDFFRKYRHYINNYSPQMDWHRFEECADQLTVPFNAEDLRSDTAANEVIKPFNKDFQKIKIALIDYLKKEQIRIPFSKKVNVSSRLSPSTLDLTFNYTNLCENYIRNIIYIHGSLAENEIVLGYDPVSPFCYSSFDTIRWHKGFCRERLNFCRYLMQQKQLFPENCLYYTLCDEYFEMQRIQNSGKGLEPEDFQKFKYSNILRQYLHEQSSVKPFDYSKIDTVLILGHSLIADKEFLTSVFGSCNNLSHAVIFTYHGEDGNELNRKKAFLSDYCKEIEFEFYD